MYEGKENPQVTLKMLSNIFGDTVIPDLKGVLRKVWHRNDKVKHLLVPANGAIAILLRLGSLDSELEFDDIKTAVTMWYKQKENEVEKRPK